MTDILADYREWAAEQPERISTHSDSCHMWHRDCMIHRLGRELARTRDELASATRHMGLAEAAWLRETSGNSPAAVVLTDAERKAVAWAVSAAEDCQHPADDALRGLMERTK